jgi:dolichol-phosphate mannosyltransferase
LNLSTRRAIAPLIDAIAFCALIGIGTSLRVSHLAAFLIGTALSWLTKPRSRDAPAQPGTPYLRLLIVTLMAFFLRAGLLALLTQRCNWSAQLSIWFVVAAGLMVTLPGYSDAFSGAAGPSRFRAFAIGMIGYAILLRLIYAGVVQLMPEETYYWNYSHHIDIGYLDHPPMVAWLIRLGTAVFGYTEFGVRLPALCCGAIASIFTYRLARNLFGDAAALASLLLAQALPFFFLSGFLTTPDAPLTAAWAASLYYLERALIGDRKNAWLLAGICLGLGMISKYSIALLAPATLVFILLDAPSRRWLLRPQPYLAALLALAIFSPVLIWNSQHDWVSFAFQTSRRLAEAPRFTLHRLIASMLILITPVGVLAIIAALWTKSPGEEAQQPSVRGRRFVNLAILVPLSVFALFSLRHEVKLDWTGALLTAALPVMGGTVVAIAARAGGMRAWIKAAWPPTVATMLLIYAAGLYYLAVGVPGLGYGKHIELVPVGWRDLSRHVIDTAASYRQETGVNVLIVGMDRYAIASEVAFYGLEQTGSTIETMNTHLFGGMSLMYGLWTPPQQQDGRDLLLVAFDRDELIGASVEAHVERLGPIEDEVLMRDGAVIRHYYLRIAHNYQSIAAK